MALDPDTRKLLEDAWSLPLFDAFFTRRSRRFGLGMEIKRGPNAYKSDAEPIPLSLEDVFAGVMPFLILDFLTLALLIAFPEIVLVLPNLMY